MFGVLRVSLPLPLPLTQAQRCDHWHSERFYAKKLNTKEKTEKRIKRSSLAQSPGLTGAAHRARHGHSGCTLQLCCPGLRFYICSHPGSGVGYTCTVLVQSGTRLISTIATVYGVHVPWNEQTLKLNPSLLGVACVYARKNSTGRYIHTYVCFSPLR